ncbi:hypothetical protein CL622_08610 [archaeon]|nr:hypothetical protein [archaeon]|tara:strand:+ start:2129 stop:2497 length:369 start_codon:yes stop_codon:yes gene_type:complete
MLTIQLVPHHELYGLDQEQKLNKILRIVKQNKVTLIEGRLKPQEETKLIEKTMEEIDKQFKGIEICSMNYTQNQSFRSQLKERMINFLTKGRNGMTIIGPASVIKQIKRNPKKIELLMHTRR